MASMLGSNRDSSISSDILNSNWNPLDILMQAPAAIALLQRPDHVYTFANPSIPPIVRMFAVQVMRQGRAFWRA
jgi:hypothetical protein